MNTKEFVAKLGELLHDAKANLVSCHLATGAEIIANPNGEYFSVQRVPAVLPDVYSEYVVVTCENGYQYFLNVSGNSLAAIAETVFSKMVCK